ncbi:MAG: hypothetical protein KAI66_27045 [Lentisphaeria bacterium]|nr:hypothetical protein [Lentisphaeria bacterium]
MRTYTEALTDIGFNTATDAITPAAYDAAKKMVLDSLACAREPSRRRKGRQRNE